MAVGLHLVLCAPFYTQTPHWGSRCPPGDGGRQENPSSELWERSLPNGLVALAGSLSQPICSSFPTDTTLAAFVTARLSTQGCSPLGIREENPKARTDLGTTRSSRLVGGTLSASAFPWQDVAGPGVSKTTSTLQCLQGTWPLRALL